jgi:hypothetical protein
MESENYSRAEIAQRLRKLSRLPLARPDDLDDWYAAATEFRAWLSSAPARVADGLPHSVWHYLQDADIRVRDAIYRDQQNLELAAVLESLECGDAV